MLEKANGDQSGLSTSPWAWKLSVRQEKLIQEAAAKRRAALAKRLGGKK